MPLIRRRLLVLLTIGGACLCPSIAGATWPHDPLLGYVSLSSGPGDKVYPTTLADGSGGEFVAWHQYGVNGADVAVQHLSASGALLWGPSGVALTAIPADQYSPTIALDGAGGLFVTWLDKRNVSGGLGTGADIYAQRLNAAGAPQWVANGVGVCTASNDQYAPRIIDDGTGGAIISWPDDRTFGHDIYAQRLNAAGTAQWAANGVAICTAGGAQDDLVMTSDGNGGTILAWDDNRGGSYQVYAQRVNGNGVPQWYANGVGIGDFVFNSGQYPAITSDGLGGAIVTWVLTSSGNKNIYAQRLNSLGASQWANSGVAITTTNGALRPPDIASDGFGGALIVWDDGRNTTDYDIYTQRITGNGARLWQTNGVAICLQPLDQVVPEVTSDGAGGAILSWEDARSLFSYDVYAQRVSAAGVPQWTANGAPIATAGGTQDYPVLVTDAAGGALVTWHDGRTGTGEINAQRITRFGYLGNPEPTIASVHDVPNDQGGRVKVTWNASYLDPASDPNLAGYDVYRSAPGSLALEAILAGARRLESFADVPIPGERAFMLLPGSTESYGWEYLGTANPAHFLASYGFIAATTGDSIGGSNPSTAFMVVGRNWNGSMYWLSAPDSGYSVDNLPPAAPAPFSGSYAAGTATLHWNANSESDLAGYELYRGTMTSFVPGPGNLVATLAETDYSDAAGQPYYYKLAAVDSHGNRSGYTLLMPLGTTAVGDGARPARLELSPVTPNPARLGPTFRYALSRAGPVSLALFDQQGRRVRTLVSGNLSAGDHVERWDGRDDSGRLAASGIYFCRLEAEGRTLTRRFATIR